jgi:hypothetical protein
MTLASAIPRLLGEARQRNRRISYAIFEAHKTGVCDGGYLRF